MYVRTLTPLLLLAISLQAETVSYRYDDAGRLTAVQYASGKTITYTYDNAGNLLKRTIESSAPATSSSKPPKAAARPKAPKRAR